MAKIPQGWVECQFSNCIDKIGISNKLKQKEYLLEGDFPVIDQGHFFVSGYYNEKKLLLKIEQPVIIFGDHTRCFKYVDFPFIAGADGIKVLKSKQFFDSKLFYYFCLALKIPNKGYSRHYQYLERTIMHIPPLNEQKRIVEKIESEFKKIDEGLEHLEKAKEQIKQYRQSVLKFAFEGKLCKISVWQESDLESISKKITDGSHVSPKTVEKSNYPYITVKDLSNGTIDFENCKFITFEDYTELEKNGCKPQQGDVLFSKDGTVGKVSLIDFSKNFVVLSSLAIIRPDQDVVKSEYLKYALTNPDFLQIALNKKTGVAIRRIILRTLKQLKIRYPKNKPEQQKIVEEIEKRFAVANEVEKVVEENIEKAKQLKQSILKKAFEGRLVPQDPKDEPASILLEKIKQERGK